MSRRSTNRPLTCVARSRQTFLWCTFALLLLLIPAPAELAAQGTSRPGASTNAALTGADFSVSGVTNDNLYRSLYAGRFVDFPFDRDEIEFATIFTAYVEGFSRRCHAHLPSDKIQLTRSECAAEEVTRNGWGVEVSRSCVQWRTVPTNVFATPEMYRTKQQLEKLQVRDVFKNAFEMLEGNIFSNAVGMVTSLQETKTDMDRIIQMNGCNSPQLKRFEENLRRYARNERPIRLAGEDANRRSNAPAADQYYASFMEDLIYDEASDWLVNKFVRGSVSDVSIQSRDRQGRPSRITARYAYTGLSDDRASGSVTLTLEDGWPECLYFFDARTMCRTPNRRILSDFADGKYAKPTPQQLAEEERRVYERAKSSRSLAAVNEYLNQYGTDGRYADEIRAIKDEMSRDAFRAAKEAHTLQAYERYLREYSRGPDADAARAEVERFDDEAYQTAAAGQSVEAYNTYLRQFPGGRHASEARSAINAIDRDAFDTARRAGTVAALQGYLHANPNGRHVQEARSLIDLTEQLEETERHIVEQREIRSAAKSRATVYGTTSFATLGGAAVLGYFAYRDYEGASDRQAEMNGLESGTPAHDEAKAEFESHATSMALFGAASLAALYITRIIGAKRAAYSLQAKEAGTKVKQLEAEREEHRQNIQRINERTLTVVPYINYRMEPGLSLTFRY